MYKTAQAKGIKHMTAFTYRFAPSLRYLTHREPIDLFIRRLFLFLGSSFL